MKKSLLFDLDGTLWDVTEVTLESTNLIAKKYNQPEISKNTVIKSFGKQIEECAKNYFPSLNINESLKLMEELDILKLKLLNKENVYIYKDVIDTIKLLSKTYDLYIVSNTLSNEYIESFLNITKLNNYFKSYIAAGTLNLTKGETINYLKEKDNLEKVIYIGDTEKDLEASKYSNSSFIFVKYGFGKDINTKYSIKEIKELPNLINLI